MSVVLVKAQWKIGSVSGPASGVERSEGMEVMSGNNHFKDSLGKGSPETGAAENGARAQGTVSNMDVIGSCLFAGGNEDKA